jgi:hypothetical protein
MQIENWHQLTVIIPLHTTLWHYYLVVPYHHVLMMEEEWKSAQICHAKWSLGHIAKKNTAIYKYRKDIKPLEIYNVPEKKYTCNVLPRPISSAIRVLAPCCKANLFKHQRKGKMCWTCKAATCSKCKKWQSMRYYTFQILNGTYAPGPGFWYLQSSSFVLWGLGPVGSEAYLLGHILEIRLAWVFLYFRDKLIKAPSYPI